MPDTSGKSHGQGVWDAIQRHLAAIDRAFQRAVRDLRLLQGERFNQMPEDAALTEEAPQTATEAAEMAEIIEISERSHQPETEATEATENNDNQPEITQEIDANGTESQSHLDLAA